MVRQARQFPRSAAVRAGAVALVGAVCLAVAPVEAQSSRPRPVIIPPAEMPVVIPAESRDDRCVTGSFTHPAGAPDGKPMIYPVHLGAGNDYLALDTALAGSPAYACDTATTQIIASEGEEVEQRWIAVVYGPELDVCDIDGARGGAYTGPCRYGWVLEGFFEAEAGGDGSMLAVSGDLDD